MPRRALRICAVLLLWLMFGAVVNIFVASVASLARPDFDKLGSISIFGEDEWRGTVPNEWPRRPYMVFQRFAFGWESVCAYAHIPSTEPATSPGDHTLDVHSAGWPLRSLRGTYAYTWTYRGSAIAESRFLHLIELPKGYLWLSWPRYFPTSPIWPGFAIDTVFFGLLGWSAVRFPGTVRRWRRHRAGKCLKCGYDLAGLASADRATTCPECGTLSSPTL